MSTITYEVEGPPLGPFAELAEKMEAPLDPDNPWDVEEELTTRMSAKIGTRIDLVPALVALLKRQKRAQADLKAMAAVRQEEADVLKAEAGRHEHQMEKIKRVLLHCTQAAGGKISAASPLEGFKSIYVRRSDRVVCMGFCKAHSGAHLEGEGCLDWHIDPESVPKAFQRITVEPRKAEIKKHLKRCDPMNSPSWAAIVPGPLRVVVLG